MAAREENRANAIEENNAPLALDKLFDRAQIQIHEECQPAKRAANLKVNCIVRNA